MRFINFWKLRTLELSTTERIFFRDAISTLQTWDILKKEHEAEINIIPVNSTDQKAIRRRGNLQNKKCISHYKKIL